MSALQVQRPRGESLCLAFHPSTGSAPRFSLAKMSVLEANDALRMRLSAGEVDHSTPTDEVAATDERKIDAAADTAKTTQLATPATPMQELSTEDSLLPKEDRSRSLIARLWLQSRLRVKTEAGGEVYIRGGRDREITLANVKVAWRLIKALRRPFGRFLLQDGRWTVSFYFLRRIMMGLTPTAMWVARLPSTFFMERTDGRVWARTRLLGVVHASLTAQTVDRRVLFKAAIVALLTWSLDDVYRFFAGRAELGSHAELMARNGRYGELFNLQKDAYEDAL